MRSGDEIKEFLGFNPHDRPVVFEILASEDCGTFVRKLICYSDASVPAFLLIPKGDGPFPAAVVHHQHNSQWHLGKSEVCGLVGNPLHAFGPALAEAGVVVLAPDSVNFEDRRSHCQGIEPHQDDWAHYFNGMTYRLLNGELLLQRNLMDSANAVSLLRSQAYVNPNRIGMLGHSYGGNTTLFHAALDERIRFSCVSGSLCSYRRKMQDGTGIELSLAIPGFCTRWDVDALMSCVESPRSMMILSAAGDPYSADADDVLQQAGNPPAVVHQRFAGGHALTIERFQLAVHWMQGQAA